jgi:hypothetical protein
MAASSLEQKLSRLEAKLKQENREARRRIDLNLDISPQRPRPSKHGGVGEGVGGWGGARSAGGPAPVARPRPRFRGARAPPLCPTAVGSLGEGHGDPGGVGPAGSGRPFPGPWGFPLLGLGSLVTGLKGGSAHSMTRLRSRVIAIPRSSATCTEPGSPTSHDRERIQVPLANTLTSLLTQ